MSATALVSHEFGFAGSRDGAEVASAFVARRASDGAWRTPVARWFVVLSNEPTRIERDGLAKIHAISALNANWDSYGASAPSHSAVRSAVRIFSELAAATTRLPAFVPLVDGGIQLEWHAGGFDIEIEIGQSGDASGFISRADDSAQEAMESDWGDLAFQARLRAALATIS